MRRGGDALVDDVDIRDYNLWVREVSPVVLILYDATSEVAYWLPIQRYFKEPATRPRKRGAKTVRIRVPLKNALTRPAIAEMRRLKWEALD